MPFFRVVLISFILIAVILPAFYAQEPPAGDPIAQAKKLIEQKKLTDAEKLLIQTMKSDPGKSNTIRFLLDKIRSMREEYNKKLKEFMALLEKGDEKAIYDKIAELEALDSSPSALGKKILTEARENAWVAINLKKFLAIMDQAALSLQAGDYKKALELYTQVFALHQKDFYDNTAYTAGIKNSVRNISASLTTLIKRFDDLLPKIKQSVDGFAFRVSTLSPDKLAAEAETVRADVNSLLQLYFAVNRVADNIQSINESIKKRYNKAKGDYHLYYLYRVIHGRDYSDHTEGILYTIQRQWEQYVTILADRINHVAEPIYVNAKQQFQSKDFARSAKNFERVYTLYLWQVKYSAQWMFVILNRDKKTLDKEEWARIKPRVPEFLQAQERAKEARSYIRLITFNDQKQKYLTQPPQTDAELETYRAEIRQTVTDVQSLAVTWQKQVKYLDEINNNGYSIGDAGSSARDMLAKVEDVSGTYQDLEKNAIRVMLEAQVDLFKKTLEQGQKDIKPAQELIKNKQPSRALAQLEQTDNTLTKLARDINDFNQKWSHSDKYISEDRAIRKAVSDAGQIKNDAERLKSGMQDDLALARKQSYEAGQHREKGLADYNNARRSFENNRFAQAKDQLRNASEELTQALNYEEDPEIRKMVDQDFIAFDKEIMEKWKNQSIIEVRNLINRAQNDYRQLLFEDAENLLLRAQDLSNEINPAKPDQEIVIWLDIVRNALSARSSREIKEEEVNYAEMTQLFNLANKDYYDGVAALKKGDKEQADKLFQSARDKIALILRSYPYHRDSRVLLYKIEQATRTRADFNRYLTLQVKNADQLLSKQNYLEAYAVYQDVQEIDSRYPGINGKVRRAEELVGIRARQPSQADQARSNELVRLARESRANQDYQTAIGYLNDALRLNPFNRTAAVLKDRINEIIAPPSSILPVEAQQLYNAAVVSYNNKEYLRARQLLGQIKRDFPQQARNTKVVELEEKIKSRIGS